MLDFVGTQDSAMNPIKYEGLFSEQHVPVNFQKTRGYFANFQKLQKLFCEIQGQNAIF